MTILSILVFAIRYSLVLNLCLNIPGTVKNISLQGYAFLKTNITGEHQCLRFCSQYKICKSINFLSKKYICELNYEIAADYANNVIQNFGSIYLERKHIPQEVTGACWEHACDDLHKCVPLKISGYTCALHDVEIGCKNPPALDNTVSEIIPGSNPVLARYSCVSRSGNNPFQDKPFSSCTKFEVWTVPTVSCSEDDCYTKISSLYEYNGRRSYTYSGKLCIFWIDASSYNGYVSNYCTAQIGYRPWCFHNSGWDYCHVVEC